MSDDPKTLPVRLCPDSLIRGVCMDCNEEFAGQLALMIILHGDVLGIVVQIACEGHMHSIARVPLHLIPVVGR